MKQLKIKIRYGNGMVMLESGVMILANFDSVDDLQKRLDYIESLYDSYHSDVSMSSQEYVSSEFFSHNQSLLRNEATAIKRRINELLD